MNAKSDQGFRSVTYFVNWAIYGRKFLPQQLPVQNLTHILYAFADVRPSGEVFLTDPYADTDIHWPGDSWNEQGNNMYGCLKQLNLHKRRNRNLKVLLSIGGWTYGPHFKDPASTPEGRAKFAETSVQLLKDHGFDGLDIDWEYPLTREEGKDYVKLLAAIREELDKYSESVTGRPHFELTVASPAGPDKYELLDVAGMDNLLDFWNVMTYDYSGSWDKIAGHQANIRPSPDNPASTPFSTTAAIDFYLDNGVAPSKIVLGFPIYGRAFEKTDGPGKPFDGIGGGSWENGVYDYKALPLSGSDVHYDDKAGASYCYNVQEKRLVSYDTPHAAKDKVKYINEKSLGGVMSWESSADKDGSESLVSTFVECLGGTKEFIQQRNCIDYPQSKFDNLKKGFPNDA